MTSLLVVLTMLYASVIVLVAALILAVCLERSPARPSLARAIVRRRRRGGTC